MKTLFRVLAAFLLSGLAGVLLVVVISRFSETRPSLVGLGTAAFILAIWGAILQLSQE
jgi:hypothetical protein